MTSEKQKENGVKKRIQQPHVLSKNVLFHKVATREKKYIMNTYTRTILLLASIVTFNPSVVGNLYIYIYIYVCVGVFIPLVGR